MDRNEKKRSGQKNTTELKPDLTTREREKEMDRSAQPLKSGVKKENDRTHH